MFGDLVCVFLGPNEFLSYNSKIAALCSDYRVTANVGIHFDESRKLTDEEIEMILEKIAQMEGLEERGPTEEESVIIERIKTFHPEVRYIIESFHPQVVVAKEGGWKDVLFNMFDFLKNPEMSKEERQAMREEIKEERAEILKLYQKNKKNFEKLDKVFKENQAVIDYMNEMVDSGKLDATSMTAFTELVTKNPDFLKDLNIPRTREKAKKHAKGTPEGRFDIMDFYNKIPDLQEWVEQAQETDDEKFKTEVVEELVNTFEEFFEKEGLKNINSFTVDIDDEVLTVVAPMKTVVLFEDKLGIEPFEYYQGD